MAGRPLLDPDVHPAIRYTDMEPQAPRTKARLPKLARSIWPPGCRICLLTQKVPPSGYRGGLTIRATRFVAELAASPCGSHLAREGQVGEGVSPTLDAQAVD